MIPRILEPEVMDTLEEAVDYDSMDHSGVNRVFVDDFLKVVDSTTICERRGNLDNQFSILDVGTGTAQIPIELCQRSIQCQVIAIDLAAEMLKLAMKNIDNANLRGIVSVQHVDAKQMPYQDDTFDAVISNSIIHHIPNPQQSLSEMLRVKKRGGILFVRDLLRPHDLDTLEQIVQTYAGEENGHQQQMFRDSLHAALSLEELHDLLHDFQIENDCLSQTTDRHWTLIVS